MRTGPVSLLSSVGVVAGMLWATAVQGQAVRPATAVQDRGGPHKMEIYNGPNRTVHYFSGSLSPGEANALRDLERSENEMAYVDSLLALRRQYADSERYLNINRAVVQDKLYGLSADTSFGTAYGGDGYYGGYGYPYYSYGGYGYGGPGAYYSSSSSSVSRSLAYGVGDEGRLKDSLVKTIAGQATPEFTAGVIRHYDTAVARAAESDRTRAVAGLNVRNDQAAPVGFEQASPATVVLKSGEKLEGRLVGEDADWIVIQTAKEEVRVRKSDVTRISRAIGGGKAPK